MQFQFFYSDPTVIFDEIGDSDVAIMPHRFPDSTNSSSEHGKFNVSWLTFSDTPNAQSCLEWWKAACHSGAMQQERKTDMGTKNIWMNFLKSIKGFMSYEILVLEWLHGIF